MEEEEEGRSLSLSLFDAPEGDVGRKDEQIRRQ